MSWDEHASGWDEDEAVRAYSRAAFARLETLCRERQRPLQDMRVLDFGCGTGLLTERLSPLCREIVAVDTSAKMIDVLREKVVQRALSNVATSTRELGAGTAADDALFASPFDLIVCSSVCAFLDDYPARVRALVELLGPSGLFVQLDWELDPEAEEPFGLTREQIRSALSKAGLESVEVETAFEVAVEDAIMKPLIGAGQTPALSS